MVHAVVGAGVAGLVTAIEAARLGVQTVLIDREPLLGGNLWYSSGHMSGAGTRRQRKAGIDDSSQKHLAEVERLGRGLTTPGLLTKAIQGAGDTLDWLDDHGFEMATGMPVIARSHEPYEVARTCWGVAGGVSILKVLQRLLTSPDVVRNLTVRAACHVTRIDLAGERPRLVLGSGPDAEVLEPSSLTIATGGFGANAELVLRWQGRPALYAGGAFADGAITANLVEQGAELLGQGVFLPTLGGYQERPDSNLMDWSNKLSINPQMRKVPEIFLDTEGRRFISEQSLSIDGVERAFFEKSIDSYFVLGSVSRLSAEQPLLGGAGASPENQKARIACIPGARIGPAEVILGDDEFGRNARAEINAVATGVDRFGRVWRDGDGLSGELYLIPCRSIVLRTWPGLKVDDEMRLMIKGKALPCVRCVGEILGGVQFSGSSFASGMSLTPAITLARSVGALVAQEGAL